MHRLSGAIALTVALALAGCSSEATDPAADRGPAATLFVVPADLADLSEKSFFDHPWPSDLRLEGGFARVEGYYNPLTSPLIDEYIDAVKGQIDGFSPVGAGYVRFLGGGIDASKLPATPRDGMDPGASVQLIDVDPASPEHGQRKLISLEWREKAGVYWLAGTLAFLPTFGSPLRRKTKYAFVVTDKVTSANGDPITPSADLEKVLGVTKADGPTAALRDAWAPAIEEVEAAGVDKASIVQMTVFTTSDPVGETFVVRDGLKQVVAAPTADPAAWKVVGILDGYTEYSGMYGPSPNFQQGTIPYASYGDGGGFLFKNGFPVVHDLFDLRFSLTVPASTTCPMPEAGYPIVLYAHGTGGDYRSYVHDGTGPALAAECIASMGIDEIFHGTRPGAPPGDDETQIEILFFNFSNITAARTNTRQAAVDEMQRARLFTESAMTVPATISRTKDEIRFDRTKVMFFGHSQGGLNGPLYLAADDSARGGVLSGSSSVLSITLLEKTSPSPSVADLVKNVFLGLNAADAVEVDSFHPAISLAQMIVDVVDPVNYALYTVREPREGFATKSVYMTEGINPDGTGDSYAPPHGIEAHAIAMGLPLELPSQHPIVESQWGGPQPITIPPDGLVGNLSGGVASGVLGQWAVPPGDDGHFVVFDVPAAKAQSMTFMRNLAADPRGEVPPP